MLDKKLKLILKEIYGFSSKNIPIVIERTDHTEEDYDNSKHRAIESFGVCHDGKTIVKHYASSKPHNTLIQMFAEHVQSFEKDFGDSTTFLSLLTAELLTLGKRISDEDIKFVLNSIDEQIESDKFDQWLKTVMKNDEVSDKVVELFSENKIHLCIKNRIGVPEDSFEVDKVIGYEFPTSIEPIFQIPDLKHVEKASVIIDKRKMDAKIYSDYVDTYRKTGKLKFVICDWYDSEVETLMNSQVNIPVVLIKCPFGKNYMLDDLIIVLGAKHESEINSFVADADLRMLNGKILFTPLIEVPFEDLQKYAQSIVASAGKKSIDILSAKNRYTKILEGQVSQLYINATSKERMTDLYEMVTDVLSSAKHLDDKYIKGYMQWYENKRNTYLETALDSVKSCFKLHDKPECFYEDAYDCANVIKAAIIKSAKFNNEILKIDFDNEIRVSSVNQKG